MASFALRGLLHGGALAIMTWGYLQLGNTVANTWIETQVGGHFQFLTIQGLCLAWVTMAISVLSDLVPGLSVLKTLKRSVFIIAMPLAVVISSIYWTLLLAAPTLILPPSPQNTVPTSSSEVPALMRLPLEHDLALHAAPALALFADFILFERRYSAGAASYGAPAAALIYCAFYSTWVEYCASFNGTFPYPFLTENPFNIRLCIYAGATTLALVSFWGLNNARRTAPLLA